MKVFPLLNFLDLYHDLSEAKSVAVIDCEIDFMHKVIAATKDNDIIDFYQDKIDSLKSDKAFLEGSVERGALTPEKYLYGIQIYMKT